jgi:CheY-like chemotaxis protein
MKTILIVDDSSVLRKLVSHILKAAGTSIVEAEDGFDAMEKLALVEPDLIIVDLNMPKMDGIEFVKNLRAHYRFLDTPIIMLTTSKDEELRREALEAGINVFLNKPVRPEILLYKVQSLLQEDKDG